MLIISALGRLRRKDQEFQASLVYMESLSQKKKKKKYFKTPKQNLLLKKKKKKNSCSKNRSTFKLVLMLVPGVFKKFNKLSSLSQEPIIRK